MLVLLIHDGIHALEQSEQIEENFAIEAGPCSCTKREAEVSSLRGLGQRQLH
jgi:hypothetical protein